MTCGMTCPGWRMSLPDDLPEGRAQLDVEEVEEINGCARPPGRFFPTALRGASVDDVRAGRNRPARQGGLHDLREPPGQPRQGPWSGPSGGSRRCVRVRMDGRSTSWPFRSSLPRRCSRSCCGRWKRKNGFQDGNERQETKSISGLRRQSRPNEWLRRTVADASHARSIARLEGCARG
jgi:hypothetical protein